MSLKAPGARKKPRDEPKDTRFQERNRLAVGVVLAAGVGFLAAMYLGSFSSSDFTEIPDWLQGLSSVVAVGISALAVYLVSETLTATRDTLNATRDLAKDTREMGEAQVRGQPFIEKMSLGLSSPSQALESQPITMLPENRPLAHSRDVFTASFSIENCGVSIIRDVGVVFSLRYSIHPANGGREEFRQSRNRFLNEELSAPTGCHLKPGGTKDFAMKLETPLTQAEHDAIFGPDKVLIVGIVATVWYRDGFDNYLKENFGFTGQYKGYQSGQLRQSGTYSWYSQDQLRRLNSNPLP